MAELQPPEIQTNGGGDLVVTSSETVGTKRHRRPSVRLGDIGDQPYYNKQWKHHSGKASKSRPLMNLSGSDFHETLDNLDSVVIGSWKVKDSKKRGSNARVRSNRGPRIDEVDGKYSGGEGEDIDDGFHEFGIENSGSPLKDQSPIHRDHLDGVDMSGPSDNDARDWKSVERNGSGEDGVRIWLNGLGLGRYSTVFEIHEVDDEVLPMLSLEDLKDMGINAVGSRRKLYSAIQRLGKGFS